MSKDIGFLIPTNRGQEFIQKTLDNINSLNLEGLTYDICIYSQEEIKGDHVLWFKEENSMGPISGFNNIAHLTDHKYITILTDDCIINEKNAIKSLVNYLQNTNKKIKIVGFGTIDRQMFYTPGLGQRIGSLLKIPYDLPRFPVARFPFIERETYNTYLNNHIFHPEFRYYAGDNWLGWWLGFMGEPYVEIPEATLSHHTTHNKNFTYEIIDCNTAFTLLINFMAGNKDYVCAEHPSYNRSLAPRKFLGSWS